MKKEDLKIVFLGTPDFAVESLDALVNNGYNVAAVVTMPDKPAGRGHKMFESPVKRYALEHNLPVLQPVRLKDEAFVEELRSIDADLFIVIAFRMLPEVVWRMPRLGTFNLHASLLPRYRGAAPINWAVINGDTVTGVTTFFLRHEIDTGEVIRQESVEILPDDNVGTLHDKLMHLGARLTLETVKDIVDGTVTTTPQEEMLTFGEEPTPAPKIFKETCRIDWTKDDTAVHNLVRGLSPYPCAWTEIYDADSDSGISADSGTSAKTFDSCNGEAAPLYNVKILETRLTDAALQPGELASAKSLLIGCGNGRALEILRLQPSGKRPMTGEEFLRGAHLPAIAVAR